jgi:hypothetical protein
MLKRFLLAAVIIVCSAAGATLGAGLLELKQLTDAFDQSKPLNLGSEITPVAAGEPQTILRQASKGGDRREGPAAL